MATLENRAAIIQEIIPRLATKSDLKDMESRLNRTMYALGFGLALTFFGVIVNILVTVLWLIGN